MIQHTAKGKGKVVVKYNSQTNWTAFLAHIS